MAKVTLNKMAPRDSAIYAQPLQNGGLWATSKVKSVESSTPYDAHSREAILKPKPPNKSKE